LGSQSNASTGGLGAGIDVSSLVNAAMANQLAELQVLQNQQSAVSTQQTSLNGFNTDLQALQTAAQALTDPVSSFTAMQAASSNNSILTATAISGSATAAHTVVVANLATTSTAFSNSVPTSSTAIAAGTLSIQVGSNTAVPIPINNTNNTLDGLAQTLNSAGIGVSASVIHDANGARLAIVSNSSGAPGNLTITPSTGALGFTVGVQGINASLTVDGIPIASTTNIVSSVISGVTLNLASAAPNTPVTVSVGPDTAQATSAINNFVSAYNTVIGDLNSQFSVSSTTGQPGPLAADSTLNLAESQILSSASFAMSGNGSVNSLAALGVTMNNDGTLGVNSTTLANALQSNFASAQSFFQSAQTGSFGANLANNLRSLADPISGAIAHDLSGLQRTQTDLTQQISDFQRQLNTQQKQLTAQFDQVDVTLQELPLLIQQISHQLTSLG
jgi:flagellar hook-associated protein 2